MFKIALFLLASRHLFETNARITWFMGERSASRWQVKQQDLGNSNASSSFSTLSHQSLAKLILQVCKCISWWAKLPSLWLQPVFLDMFLVNAFLLRGCCFLNRYFSKQLPSTEILKNVNKHDPKTSKQCGLAIFQAQLSKKLAYHRKNGSNHHH